MARSSYLAIAGMAALLVLAACDQEEEAAEREDAAPAEVAMPAPTAAEMPAPTAEAVAEAPTVLLWGDTHLHTSNSPDAYLMQNRSADPDTAYRFAKGLPVIHPYNRAKIQIETPLDFLVVSDHAEFMGVIPKIVQGDPMLMGSETARRYHQMAQEGRETEIFAELIAQVNDPTSGATLGDDPNIDPELIQRTIWGEIMDAAERHNDPGTFTTFLGWEWSSTPGGANLHRIVIMRDGKEIGEKLLPYSSIDSARPEDLWAWLEKTTAETGATIMAIPHNMNISKGLMFPLEDSEGRPIDADYAKLRITWEPIAEVTQVKGDSETHQTLSTTDEFAEFESYEHLIQVGEAVEKPAANPGDFARSALKRGLEIEARVGVNPYKFGMIGSTDSHTGASTAEENNFWGKFGFDSIPDNKTGLVLPGRGGGGSRGWDMSASGLAAVWAEENTREAIFDALRRKEVYSTTGPRIAVRFFGGFNFGAGDADVPDLARVGYEKGVPMGGDLANPPDGAAPAFLIHAAKDPKGANLDRVQVVKGWLDDDGAAQERVYDVVWSDTRVPGADGKLPRVGNTVDLATGTYTNDIGDAQLAAVWRDPDFDAGQLAFYYVRVLQIPTPRNSLYDAIALGVDPEETGKPATIQERAYTSPIWYTPSG